MLASTPQTRDEAVGNPPRPAARCGTAQQDAVPARRLFRDQRGAVAVTTALVMTVLIGFAGLAIDVGKWEATQRRMQAAADNAAYSAALANQKGASTQSAKDVGYSVASSMGFANDPNGTTVEINNPPKYGKYAGVASSWEAIITQPQKTWLASLYLSSDPTAGATAEAHSHTNGQYCMLSTAKTGSSAVNVWGSTVVNMPGCNLQVNSSDPAALTFGGNSSFTADYATVNGGYTVGSSADIGNSTVESTGSTIPDPYAGTQVPSYSCTGGGSKIVHSSTPSAGTYCNGMSFTGNGTFTLCGTYIIPAGSFDVGGTTTVNSCPTGVTIIITGTASVYVHGGTTVNLTAQSPTSPNLADPSLAGFVFFQDPADKNAAILNGGANQTYAGALYFPTATSLTYSGDSTSYGGTVSQCTQVVAYNIQLTGNSTFNDNCTGYGTKTITDIPTSLTG